MSVKRSFVTANVVRFDGFADRYDFYRPHPPAVIADILSRLVGARWPALVVDIGCGTGLSTRLWAGRAGEVVGIDPNRWMIEQAVASGPARPGVGNIRYAVGFSHETGLADGCADVVTCSQSLQWMEPKSTLGEVARILRPGGVFAAYDCDWPPTLNWEAEAAYRDFMRSAIFRGVKARGRQGLQGLLTAGKVLKELYGVKKWSPKHHLKRLRASGHFRFVKEITVHSVESGDAARLVGLALSQGGIATLLRHGLREEEIGLEGLRAAVGKALGAETVACYFSYRIRLGIK